MMKTWQRSLLDHLNSELLLMAEANSKHNICCSFCCHSLETSNDSFLFLSVHFIILSSFLKQMAEETSQICNNHLKSTMISSWLLIINNVIAIEMQIPATLDWHMLMKIPGSSLVALLSSEWLIWNNASYLLNLRKYILCCFASLFNCNIAIPIIDLNQKQI